MCGLGFLVDTILLLATTEKTRERLENVGTRW